MQVSSRVDIVIRYIEVDFTFALLDDIRYNEEFVISRFVMHLSIETPIPPPHPGEVWGIDGGY